MLSGLGKAASVLFSGADPGQGGLLWGLPLQKVAGSGKGNRLCFLSGLGDSMEERVDRFCQPSGDISAFDSAKGGPGRSISVERTPKLARAAAKSLRQRGMTTAGWAAPTGPAWRPGCGTARRPLAIYRMHSVPPQPTI